MRDQDNNDPDYLFPGTYVVFSGGELVLMAVGGSKKEAGQDVGLG